MKFVDDDDDDDEYSAKKIWPNFGPSLVASMIKK